MTAKPDRLKYVDDESGHTAGMDNGKIPRPTNMTPRLIKYFLNKLAHKF